MKNNFAITYFITRPFFLGIIYSLIFLHAKNDAILSCIIGTILGIFIIFIMHKLKINKVSKYYNLLIYSFFIVISIVILENFIYSFFLTNTPKLIIIIPTILLCFYTVITKTNIKRLSNVLIIISIIFIFLIIFSLTSYINIQNLFPLFHSNKISFIKSCLIYASMSAFPSFLLLENVPLKDNLISYIITSILNTIICIVIISSLTINVARIYSFPEYMLLKRIKLFEFIENIENIAASLWYFDIFIFMSLNFEKVYKDYNKFILIIWSIIIMLFTTLFITSKYTKSLLIYHNSYIIVITLFSILIILSYIKKAFFKAKSNVIHK